MQQAYIHLYGMVAFFLMLELSLLKTLMVMKLKKHLSRSLGISIRDVPNRDLYAMSLPDAVVARKNKL